MKRCDGCGRFQPIARYGGLDLCAGCLLPAVEGVTKQLLEQHGANGAEAMRRAKLPQLVAPARAR